MVNGEWWMVNGEWWMVNDSSFLIRQQYLVMTMTSSCHGCIEISLFCRSCHAGHCSGCSRGRVGIGGIGIGRWRPRFAIWMTSFDLLLRLLRSGNWSWIRSGIEGFGQRGLWITIQYWKKKTKKKKKRNNYIHRLLLFFHDGVELGTTLKFRHALRSCIRMYRVSQLKREERRELRLYLVFLHCWIF